MEDLIQNYKCPSCSAPLSFNASNQTLHCDSCGTDFTLDTLKALSDADLEPMESKYDWEKYEPRSYEDDGEVKLSGYSCPSCGAEITGDDTLGSTICPYCGNSTIVKKQFEGSLRPDFVIPFKIDKKAAIKAFEDAYAKAPFLPDEFKNKNKIAEMAGVYVPFWNFDCDCNAQISYRAQRTTVWSDSSYNYTKTDHYKILRSGKVGFEHIPVDGSQKADNTYMEAIEPYNYNEAVDFNTAYLSGYLADKYDVSADESQPRANQRVTKSTETAFMSTVHGYNTVIPESSAVNFSNGKIRYSLLPVWMLNIKYMDKMYKYAINGQTGKVAGVYPIDKKKKWFYFGKMYALSLVICAVGSVVLHMIGII